MITKTNPLSCYSVNKHKVVSFGAGKIDFFSDFDGTYCPLSQNELKVATPSSRPDFTEYCKKLKNFFNNTKDGLKFHVTTGRTFGEYESVSNLIRGRGFELPLPDTFIAKNGSDEYLRLGTDTDFYNNGIFPFRYDKTNIEKENKIKELTGWDGTKIKSKLKELLKEHGFRIVEGDSEFSPTDYGSKSLFEKGKLPYETKKIPGSDTFDWSAGFRKDGNCKLFVTYPPDMTSVPERRKILNDINEKMSEYLKDTKLTGYTPKQRENDCGGRLCNIIEPLVDEGLAKRTPKKYLKGLTKLYDTKEAVKKAIKNNDLVIVAGDGSNDFTMLNPLLYIDVPQGVYEDDFLKGWDKDCAEGGLNIVKNLRENIPLHKNIAKQIDDLPLMGVVVNTDKDKLSGVRIAFAQGSRFGNIITVENGKLEDGIKEAVKVYCVKHPEYAEKLNPDLKKEVFGTTGDISQILRETAKKINFPLKEEEINASKPSLKEKMSGVINKFKNNKKIKYLLSGIFAAGIIFATILCVRKIKNKQKNHRENFPPLMKSTLPACFSEFSKIVS